ncbi:MAG TPA: cold shock domain-containing protein [Roseiarcus sp.]|jgi:CspA family cold shock protein|nr:cold shock domain-containing protein [Roseiarcus sp.]
MNKAKDFWAPRRHGFDDDGPISYPPRLRPARFDGPSVGLGDVAAPGDLAASSEPAVEATVKWYKDDKGYGFVELADGQGDAFLHATVLHAAGHETAPPGTKMRVAVAMGVKGPQVSRVVSVDAAVFDRPRRPFDAPRPPRRMAPDPSTARSLEGRVKWFNENKGFGFVEVEDGGKDIFVHISALNAAGIARLDEGQPVNMKVVETPRGREAISIAL